MTNYVPIAGRASSSLLIEVMCKRAIARALVESSLLHLAHVRCLKVRELKKFNAVYMRVHRRIIRMCVFGITLRAWIASSPEGACCQVHLGHLHKPVKTSP